jgi:hypothetical protein
MLVNELIAKLDSLPPGCRTWEVVFPVQTSPNQVELLPVEKMEQTKRVDPFINEVKPIILIS